LKSKCRLTHVRVAGPLRSLLAGFNRSLTRAFSGGMIESPPGSRVRWKKLRQKHLFILQNRVGGGGHY